MKTSEYFEFIAPAWFVPVAINDDWTGLSPAECAAAKIFLERLQADHGPGHICIDTDCSPDFGANDIDSFFGDTYQGTYLYK